LYKHGSPYTYFSSAELHLGEISLECSRPGAAAVALWATQQLLPLKHGGEFAEMLDDCLYAARSLWNRLQSSPNFVPLMEPELDIVVYAVDAADSTTASARTRALFKTAAEHDLHLAMIELPVELVRDYASAMNMNSETITCLRSVLMKPEHRDWLDRIVDILESSVTA
ncbi:MAG: aspartate aminotransferase family protein, partial [Gammaproteobacteria bacterium]|nr:aspartate aminotransferase family protein [Gammaproteobacteria bacterium]